MSVSGLASTMPTITSPTIPTSAITGSSTSSSSSSTNTAMSQLSGNFDDFLKLLMTQLQNQDPTQPMDSSTFTSQLVQYASVEQQINVNTNLGTLISATQNNTVLQASALEGKQVTVTNNHLALQNSSAAVNFTTTTAEPVNITVTDAAGAKVLQTTVEAAAGSNTWSWNGQDSSGNTLADGSYAVTVQEPSGNALTTSITGTVTGLAKSGTSVELSLGALQTDVGTVQSVNN